MDRAVLSADGWSDLEVPPFCPLTPADQKALESFQDQVIDRLFLLNADRAQEEARLGTAKKPTPKPKPQKKAQTHPTPRPGKPVLVTDPRLEA